METKFNIDDILYLPFKVTGIIIKEDKRILYDLALKDGVGNLTKLESFLVSTAHKLPFITGITSITPGMGHGSISISAAKSNPDVKLVGNIEGNNTSITYTNVPWITEGTPDTTGDYLITVEDENFLGVKERYVEICSYYTEAGDGEYEFAGWQTTSPVLAWAPIMIEPHYEER